MEAVVSGTVALIKGSTCKVAEITSLINKGFICNDDADVAFSVVVSMA